MNSVADIDLGSGLRRLVDLWIDEVRCGLRRFWRGGEYANAPACYASALITRMQRLLRFTFLILALYLELPPVRASGRPTAAGLKARGPGKPTFRLFGRWRVTFDDVQRPQPAALARAALQRDRFLTARRRLDALTRALADPLPIVRRIARRLPTQLMVFAWRPPKRPPPTHRRDFCESLVEAYREARHHLSQWRRRTFTTASPASGS